MISNAKWIEFQSIQLFTTILIGLMNFINDMTNRQKDDEKKSLEKWILFLNVWRKQYNAYRIVKIRLLLSL
jgi:hypothetical protein